VRSALATLLAFAAAGAHAAEPNERIAHAARPASPGS
jgi:hypothetical protein